MTAAEIGPPTHPLLNVLTHGFRSPHQRVPENAETIRDYQDVTMWAFSPRSPWHLWLTDDVALTMVRMDRLARIERRERDRAALRAEFCWDDDRRLLAEDLGARLERDPGRVVPKLKATPQGCDWLIERWGWLGRVVAAGKTWDDGQARLALDLMGTPKEVRADAAWLADPAKLVRDEVAALESRKARVAEADALDRSLAMADLAQPNTIEFRRLKREESRLHRQMQWSIKMLDLIPRYAEPHPEFVALRERPKPAPTPPERVSRPEPQPQGEPRPDPEDRLVYAPTPTPSPTPSRRPDPAKQRSKRRDEAARKRRNDRPDR